MNKRRDKAREKKRMRSPPRDVGMKEEEGAEKINERDGRSENKEKG